MDKKPDYITNKAKQLQVEHQTTWETAITLAYLDSIGFRVYEILQEIKKKKETNKKENR